MKICFKRTSQYLQDLVGEVQSTHLLCSTTSFLLLVMFLSRTDCEPRGASPISSSANAAMYACFGVVRLNDHAQLLHCRRRRPDVQHCLSFGIAMDLQLRLLSQVFSNRHSHTVSCFTRRTRNEPGHTFSEAGIGLTGGVVTTECDDSSRIRLWLKRHWNIYFVIT